MKLKLALAFGLALFGGGLYGLSCFKESKPIAIPVDAAIPVAAPLPAPRPQTWTGPAAYTTIKPNGRDHVVHADQCEGVTLIQQDAKAWCCQLICLQSECSFERCKAML